ncbi:unnamed protein product [Prunus armeniaca]|uniref:F-box domain-containing protein n=1 Tax=Prunus armeniaca TaxID=36596 RepID=A0A6J5U3W8_PRUAR|nr:unnamed protein product [Prunus armeniaca]
MKMIDVLPTDILTDILSRLPVKSVCCIRCVSKALLKTVDDVSFATMHMRRRLLDDVHQVPRLVLRSYYRFEEQRMQTFKYDGNDLLTKSKPAIISEFKSRQYFHKQDFVFCNLFGFTSLSTKNERSCLLVNPFKGEFLMLPTTSELQAPANIFSNSDTYGMGFDTMTNTYKIVRVSRYLKKDYQTYVVTAEVLVLGTSSWRELPLAPPCYPSRDVASSTYEAVHWLVSEYDNNHGSSRLILSFDFKNEEFYLTPHPFALNENLDFFSFVHLLTFRGSLALVDVSSSNIEIWVLVLKNYDGKKKHEWKLNYKIDMQQHPLRVWHHTYELLEFGEWEHGIFFHENYCCLRNIFFVDLTRMSVKLFKDRLDFMMVYSCTDNMISLKNYGDLAEVEEQRYTKFIIERETQSA